jgi:hypothetical protein
LSVDLHDQPTRGCAGSPFFSRPVDAAMAVLLGLAATLSAATAQAIEIEVAGVSHTSEWRERDESAHLLVREHGRLSGLRATAATAIGADWGAALVAQQVSGARSYLGQTNSGQPAQSSADIQEWLLEATLDRRLGGGWSATAGWQRTRLARDLHGTATAAGYPETWRWDAVSTGLNWQRRFDRVGLRLHARAGAVVDSAMSVTFPGRDVTHLRPAQGRQARIGLEGRWDLADGARPAALVMSLNREITRFQTSPSRPVTSSGVLRGVARQPATAMTSTGLLLGVQLSW